MIDWLQWLVVTYCVLGSYSLGYFLLRSGWPKIRILEEPYRVGWSVAVGLLFTLSITGISWYEKEALQFAEPFEWTFIMNWVAALLVATLLLYIRRKYIASKNIQVAVPKDYMTAKIAAEKLTEKIFMEDKPSAKPMETEDVRMDEVRKTLDKLTQEIGQDEEKPEEDST